MIKPTVGRVVHYYDMDANGPWCALIAYVHDDRLVNLAVFDRTGGNLPQVDIPLAQPEDYFSVLPPFPRAEWMPYQLKKDFGSESGERAAGKEEV